MQLVHCGQGLPTTREALAAAHPGATPCVAVLVHGLMSTEDVFRMPDGETYGTLLARDLGYTPFYVRYNSGLHVSENGEALDNLLEQLVEAYPVPVEEVVLHGHSMAAPCIFVQGTADPFGSPVELQAAIAAIPGPTQLIPVERAGHDLKGGRFDLAEPVGALARMLAG